MKTMHEDLDKKEFEKPDGIYTKYVNGRREIFVDGTEPHYTNKLGWYRSSSSTKKESNDDDNNNNNKKSSKSILSSENNDNNNNN